MAPLEADEAIDEAEHSEDHDSGGDSVLVLVKHRVVVFHAVNLVLLVGRHLANFFVDLIAPLGEVKLTQEIQNYSEKRRQAEDYPGSRLQPPDQLEVPLRLVCPLREELLDEVADRLGHLTFVRSALR